VVLDPAGREVAQADEVELVPSVWSALAGYLHFRRAVLRRGAVRLVEGESGLPTLIESFQPVDPTPSDNPLRAVIDGVRIEDVTVTGDLLGTEGLRVENLVANGRLEAEGPLDIRIYDGTADVVEPWPFHGRVEHVVARINTDPAIGISLNARGTIEREDGPSDYARVDLEYALPEGAGENDPQELRLVVEADPVDARLLHEIGYPWAERFTGPIAGRFVLAGPPEQTLAMRVRANTDGGRVRIDGRIHPDRLELEGRTRGLDLERVLRDMPPLRVAGDARMEIDTSVDDAPPRVHVEIEPTAFGELAIPSFVADGTLHDDHVVIDSIEAPYADGEVQGEGVVRFDGSLDVRVRGRIPQIARDPNVRRLVPSAAGSVSGEVRLALGPPEDQRMLLSGRLTFSNFRYPPITAARLVVDGTARGSTRRPAVDVRVTGEAVRVSGYPLGAAALDVEGGPRDYRVTGSFTEPDRRVDLEAAVVADGRTWTVDAPRIEYSIGRTVWRGKVTRLVWTPNVSVTAQTIQLVSGSQRLEVGGTWRFRGPEDIRGELQDFELAGLRALLPDAPDIGGRVDTVVTIQGDIERPVLYVQGALREGKFLGLDGAQALYAVGYDQGTLTVDGTIEVEGRGALMLSGTGMLDPTIPDPLDALEGGVYDLDLDVFDVDLPLLAKILGDRYPAGTTGRLQGRVELDGPVFAPSLNGRLRVAELVVPGWPAIRAGTSFTYDNGVLAARLTTHDAIGELVETEGSLLIDLVHLVTDPEETVASLETLPWRVSVRVPPRVLGELPAPVRARIPEELHPLSASLSGTFAGGAFQTRGDLYVTGDWEGSLDAFCASRGQPRFTLSAELREGVTRVEGRGFVGPRRVLDASFTMPTPLAEWLAAAEIPEVPPVTMTAMLREAPLEALPFACEYFSGPTTAAIRAEGLFTDEPRATAEVHTAAVRVLGTEPVRADLDVRVVGGMLTMDGNVGWWSGERALVDARVPVTWGRTPPWPVVGEGEVVLAADFQDAPIAPFLVWVPQIADVAGHMSGRVEATGPLDRLRTRGAVALRDGYLEIRGLGQHLTDIEGDVEFMGNWAQLRGITARDGDGAMQIDGGLGFDGPLPRRARLSINATSFPVRQEGTLLATVTGNAGVAADIGLDHTELAVEVRRLDIRLPDEGTRTLQELEDHPDIEFVGEDVLRDDEEPYHFNVRVDASLPFWVRRSDFQAQIVSDLDVRYVDPDLYVGGNVELRRGFFEVFGKRFVLDRGEMQFDGDPDLNPRVNLVARHAMRRPSGTVVTVTVTGTFNEPEIDFRSNHPECTDRGQVIAMLVSGRCNVASTDDSGDVGTDDAREFLAGVLAGITTLWAQEQLGGIVDTFIVERTEGATTLRVGRSLDEFIPGFLRPVVEGVRAEGVGYIPSADPNSNERTSGLGVRVELDFPHDLVGTGEYQPPSNWSLDLTWEP
jgi:translocation and assembly module TamB